MKKMLVFFCLLSLLSVGRAVEKKIALDELLNMSLEELLNIEIRSGTLTNISIWKNPVARTVIERDQIENAPVRHLLDLLEIYVPGFTYVEHYQGPRMGLRGMLGDQNYSFLLLVNGKNTNLKQYHGPYFDLQNKDLSDIEKIEIIRGPGSVTYGPGAISGIINIITFSPQKDHYFRNSYLHDFLYRFDRYSFSSQFSGKHLKTSLYLSHCRSKGEKDTKFWYIDRAYGYGYGFMNQDWGNYGLGTQAPQYLSNYLDYPEIKLQLTAELPANLFLWSRYTTANQTQTTQSRDLWGKDYWNGHIAKQFIAELQHSQTFSDQLKLESKLGFDSASIRDYRYWQGEDLEPDNVAQLANSYSENEINLKLLLHHNLDEKISFAHGFEFNYDYYKPEWGDDEEDMLITFQPPLKFVVADSSSDFYQLYDPAGLVTLIDEEIDGWSYSFLTESNITLNKFFQVLLSARLDKHQYAKHAFSPRIALISPINEKNICKLILQRSVRLPNFSNLYSQHYLEQNNSDFEEMEGIEIAYQRIINPKLTLYLNSYFNSIDQIAWIPIEDNSGKSGLAGNFEIIGSEAELKFKGKKTDFGLNYSFIDQVNWSSDFDDFAYITIPEQDSIPIVNNADNRINNLPKHSLKTCLNFKLTDEFSFYADARLGFDYQQNEMLDKFEEALLKSDNEEYITEWYNLRTALEDHGYGKPSFTSDFSLNWRHTMENCNLKTRFYARNVFQKNHIRYIIQYWETGNLRQYPRQCGFIEEPWDIGLEIALEF